MYKAPNSSRSRSRGEQGPEAMVQETAEYLPEQEKNKTNICRHQER